MGAARLNGEGLGAGGAGLGRARDIARDGDAARGNDLASGNASGRERVAGREHVGGRAHAGGRPAVLDAIKRAEVCALLASGCSLRTAANYVNCDVSTISKLKARDAAFRDQVAKAMAEREAFPLSKVREACGRSWRAARWLLERTVGGHFRRDSTENAVDWEQALLDEAVSRAPTDAARVVEKLGGESEQQRLARWMEELEMENDAEEETGREGPERVSRSQETGGRRGGGVEA